MYQSNSVFQFNMKEYCLIKFPSVKKKPLNCQNAQKVGQFPKKTLQYNFKHMAVAYFCICLYTVALSRIGRAPRKCFPWRSAPLQMQCNRYFERRIDHTVFCSKRQSETLWVLCVVTNIRNSIYNRLESWIYQICEYSSLKISLFPLLPSIFFAFHYNKNSLVKY